VAVVAMFFAGALLITRNDNKSSTAEPAATVETVEVSLSSFKIEPAELHIPKEGANLKVTNIDPQAAHTLAIPELGVQTAEVQPGASVTVKIGASAEGSYEMYCTVAGHKEAGMKGLALVGNTDQMGGGTDTVTPAEMDAMMLAVAQKFPAKTEGHGGDLLAPTILADGTKEFDLTAKVVQWEVSPGKKVDAWTYNGVVPAPEIHVEVGDKVKVVLKNELPESTSLHWHGIRVPNVMDGVDPYTQAPILSGQSFTYEFTALEPAVGIYHSHHDAQLQIPNGMFGAVTIGEMPLPDVLKAKGYDKVTKKINMVLNDSGTIGLSLNGKSFPATEPYTLKVGDVMEVNYFNEGLMGHPMHLHQPSGWIIAKDGEPMLTPVPGDTIWVAPGERYTVLYKAVDPGVWAWHCHILTHAESATGMFGMVTALIVEQ
jgi:FtsP/CotA-like multicopper oxidase with cupredoxin domain